MQLPLKRLPGARTDFKHFYASSYTIAKSSSWCYFGCASVQDGPNQFWVKRWVATAISWNIFIDLNFNQPKLLHVFQQNSSGASLLMTTQ